MSLTENKTYRILGVDPGTVKMGYALLEINGKPIIQHVYERVSQVELLDDVIVLTDDERIANVIKNINGNVAIIKNDCLPHQIFKAFCSK